MTSLADRHLYPIFMLPSQLLAKFRGWVYGYIRLLLGMVCSVSCIFCVFTFIWYLTFRGLYGFLINLQLYQPPTGCGSDDDSDLTIEYTDYQSGKRGSFMTRCRAQAELIQQTLKKSRTNGDKSPNGHNGKLSSGDVTQENNGNTHHHHRCHNHNHNHNHSHSHHHHHHHHNSPNKESSGLLVRNSSYVSEIYYDENGHKIGEQIYLTNDSDGLEESYFQFKVNDVQHLKELGGSSTSVLVTEEPFDDEPQQYGEADVENFPGDEPEYDKHVASGGDFDDKIVDPRDDNNGSTTASKDRSILHLSMSHSPESTTSYCGSIIADEPAQTFEDDSSAKTVIINEKNTTLSCSKTIIPTIKTTNQQSLLLKSKGQENGSSNNNHRDKICSITTQVQPNKYPIEPIKEEETKDLTINKVHIPEPSTEKVNCNDNDVPNGVQLKGNPTSESEQTPYGGVIHSLLEINKSQSNKPANQPVGRKKPRRSRLRKNI